MANGYTGKIARVNLTTKQISTIDTEKYAEFGGGYGIGAALFWELSVAPGEWDLKDPYDPHHVLPIMAGPLAATGVPGAGRTSICGLSPETYPTSEFNRGNFGGRFATMLKLAGWDGIVVEGMSENPVWINIINDQIKIEDGKELWGTDTWETQKRISDMVGGRTRYGEDWRQIDKDYTTGYPQILCIGPVGETRSRLAALITGSGVSSRVGGYGAVFGAKKLKAISVIGTKGIKIADAKGIMDARLWHMANGNVTSGSFGPAKPGSASCNPCLRADRRRNSINGGETMCVHCQVVLHIPGGYLTHSEVPKLKVYAGLPVAVRKFPLFYWNHPVINDLEQQGITRIIIQYGLWGFCQRCHHQFSPAVLINLPHTSGEIVDYRSLSSEEMNEMKSLRAGCCPYCSHRILLVIISDVPHYVISASENLAHRWEED